MTPVYGKESLQEGPRTFHRKKIHDTPKRVNMKERENITNKNVSFPVRILLYSVRCESHAHTAQTHAEKDQESWGGAGETARKPLPPRLLHLSKRRSAKSAVSRV